MEHVEAIGPRPGKEGSSMTAALSVLQVLGLVLAGIVGGAALLTLLLGWLAGISGDDAGAGCLGLTPPPFPCAPF